MTTPFAALVRLAGLSTHEAAIFFDVSYDTVKDWTGPRMRRRPGPGVVREICDLIIRQEQAAMSGDASGYDWPGDGPAAAAVARMTVLNAKSPGPR